MKSILRKGLVAILALAMLLSSLGTLSFVASATTELVTNGTFDNGTTGFTNASVATFEVVDDPTDATNKVLHLVGPGNYFQLITVEANTDYTWTFRMRDVGNTGTTRIFVYPESSWDNLITDIAKEGDGYVNLNDGTYTSVASYNQNWMTVTVKFNSGDNTAVKLFHNTWADTREIYMDDWSVTKPTVIGDLVNGDFENGTTGFINIDTATFEVIEEPDNTANHVLHLVGGDSAGNATKGSYYQPIAVEPDTDYIWTFRMKDLGNTGTTRILVYPEAADTNLITSISQSGGGYAKLNDGYASAATYNQVWSTFTVTFNSGDNSIVRLYHNTWASTREIYMDDWACSKAPVPGELVNGDFENGLEGYIDSGMGTMEVIADPDNADNHILHVIGGGSYYQPVLVEANTDYVWKFRMKDIGNTGTTRILVHPESTWETLVTSISHVGTGYSSMNDGAYSSVATYNQAWVEFTVRFNSGDNTTVKLWHNTWTTNREIYMDDWTFSKAAPTGEILNGDFENGLEGYTVGSTAAAAVVTDEIHGGTNAISVSGTDGAAFGQYFYQQIAVEKNTDYAWSFWYKSVGTRPAIVGVTTPDQKYLLPSFIKSNGGYYTGVYNGINRASYTSLRALGTDQWHESLLTAEWKQYVIVFNSGDNDVVNLTFDMITSARSGYTDDWSVSEYSFTAGDVNNDGTLDANDLVAMRQYLLTEVAEYYKSGIDANGNGTVDVKDLVNLKKKLSELNVLEGYSLVWADDFNASLLDGEKWLLSAQMSGQDDLEIRSDESAVSVADGSVTLSSGKAGDDTYYTNASLTTKTKMVFRYGYVEMRAKVPFGAPAFPSFWMKSAMLEDDTVMGEIDIFEHFCEQGSDYIQSGIHKWYQDEASTHMLNDDIGGYNFGSEALAEEWHTYGILWTEEKIDFMVDGEVYHSISLLGEQQYTLYNADGTTSTVSSDMAAFHDYFYLIMNNYLLTPNGMGEDGYTADSTTEFPIDYEIDYVRLYQKTGETDIVYY